MSKKITSIRGMNDLLPEQTGLWQWLEDRVRGVLAKLTPANLHPDALATGEVRRTRLAQVPAAVWLRDEDTAELICFRSVARYVFDLLSNAARQGTDNGLF